MRPVPLFSTLAVALLGAGADAQLVFGSTSTSTTTSGAYYLDVTTGVAKQLWVGPGSSSTSRKVNGLAADAASGVIYGNDSARLYKWGYGGVGTNPTYIGGLYRAGAATGADDLAFARGNLYAYTNSASATNLAGIYKVDPTNATASGTNPNMTPVWTQANNLQYNFQGLNYDPVTGLMYATNTPISNAPTTPAGLYAIDIFSATQTVTKIADFDAGFLPAPDGLAIGNGKVWMSGKAAGRTDMLIESFNLTTHVFDDPFSLDLGDTNARATGMTWAPGALTAPVPEPAAFLPLGLGAWALIRRRQAVSRRCPTTPA